jgi:UDP-glucose 4-epimerase
MILVTGASGHLGQWVVAALTSRGHDVLCAARRPLEAPAIAGLAWSRPVRTAACDLGQPDGLDALRPHLPSLRAVVHLGAHVPAETARNADEDGDATFRANTAGTARLLALLAEAPRLEAVVYASTFEVYGPVFRLPIDEQHPTAPTNYYGASKLAGEKYLRLFAGDRTIPGASLRLPAIYGPGDGIRRAIGNFVRAAAAGTPIEIQGDGADLRELIYAGDAAEAVALCLERRGSGVFNVASGRGISIREMAEAAQRAGRDGGHPQTPGGGSAPVVFRDRVKPRADYVLSIERARHELGWSPTTSLDEGVRAQLAWVRGHDGGP